MTDPSDDSAFLAEVTAFLSAHEASVESAVTSKLLYESDQLLAETEALLHSSTDVCEPRASISTRATLLHTKKAQAVKRRLQHQAKAMDERHELKKDEKELANELEKLQRARKRAKVLGDGSLLPLPAWRALAIRQKEALLVARQQRRQLQNAVETRAEMIKKVGLMMQQQLSEATEKGEEKSVQLHADDTVLFEAFLQEMDELYAQTEEIFRSHGAEKNPVTSYRLGPELKIDQDVEYIDTLDVLLIPFTLKETCSTMWQSMVRLYQQKNSYHYNVVTEPENTLAVKLHVRTSSESGEIVDMLVLFVMRRYFKAEQMVVVWRALSEGEGKFSGIHSDETGWCMVRPNDLNEPLLRTVMQTFVRFIPMDIANTSDASVDGFQFTKAVVTSVEEDGAEVARMMDSLLLEDSDRSHCKVKELHM